MTDGSNAPKRLRTWHHLASERRRPSEYEIVSTHVNYTTDRPERPFELDPDLAMNRWYRRHREGSPLRHENWHGFRDPDELVYRTYNILQDGQEAYVDGLLDEFSDIGHDAGLPEPWVETLAVLYAPGRYLMHALQMASAYISQMAPASTIQNCATFQAADSLRALSLIAYRTRQLADAWPAFRFGDSERSHWEHHPAWQGFRAMMEKALVAYDWGEAFAALQLVAKPAVEAGFFGALTRSGRRHDDTFVALLNDALLRDCERHRRWTSSLLRHAVSEEGNRRVLLGWIDAWYPVGRDAVWAFAAALPEGRVAVTDADADFNRLVNGYRNAITA